MMLLSVTIIVMTMLVKNTGTGLSGAISGGPNMENAKKNTIDSKTNRIIAALATVDGAVIITLSAIIARIA